jgi:site-specific DNA-methyltransferase (adenine-specific)
MTIEPTTGTATQLGLELDAPALIPALPIEPEWKDQPRLWGPALHPMCSYLASFPAALAHAFIGRYSRRGDVVLDPFSGRGTTPLQACAEGRVGVGNDLNPLAHLLTAAKVEPATRAETATRLASLRLTWSATADGWLAIARDVLADLAEDPAARPSVLVPAAASRRIDARVETVPREVAVAFHARTLAQLLHLRTALDPAERVDRFVAAALTGILHGKSASYLSPIMPNTFSMAPRYVREFAARTAFAPPERDAFAGVERKLARLHREPLPGTAGVALLGDARDVGGRARAQHARRRPSSRALPRLPPRSPGRRSPDPHRRRDRRPRDR